MDKTLVLIYSSNVVFLAALALNVRSGMTTSFKIYSSCIKFLYDILLPVSLFFHKITTNLAQILSLRPHPSFGDFQFSFQKKLYVKVAYVNKPFQNLQIIYST